MVSKIRGVAFSLVYVTGIAITYSALGLFASLTGKIFGEVSSHPAAYFIVGVLIIIFGISMLDVFSLNLPSFLRLPEARSHSYISVFTLGLASGLIVGPCLTPVLGSILAYLITRKNIIYGMTLLFSFAYGMGFILIIVGIFSSILMGLPKLGRVMVYVKKISGVILITMGIYFIILGIRRI